MCLESPQSAKIFIFVSNDTKFVILNLIKVRFRLNYSAICRWNSLRKELYEPDMTKGAANPPDIEK